MAALAQRTQAVEEKVDSLESILTRFMARIDESMARTDKAIVRLDLEGIVGKHSVYRCGAAGHTRIGVLRDEVWEDSGGVRKAARGRAGAR